jgi:hypothetical protein
MINSTPYNGSTRKKNNNITLTDGEMLKQGQHDIGQTGYVAMTTAHYDEEEEIPGQARG